jgi:6-phosphogluconate dehydrogenase
MGQNLALNIARNGFPVAVYNRTGERTAEFVESLVGDLPLVGTYSIEEFVQSLKQPRRVMLMVQAGSAVDAVIAQLRPLLEPGDIVIDGGNSFFQDTRRREKELRQAGIQFLGVGVSGGEEGALNGPSIMPGGPGEAYEAVAPILTKIAAQVDGESCCTHIGPDGAGHYVKMVHNGIEYADMQLIAEAYFLLAHGLGMAAAELAEVFARWNEGDLDSYLVEITAAILWKTDDGTGQPLVDLILDKAGQKGTGKWTSQSALDLGTPAATVAEAVFARAMSAQKDLRTQASRQLRGPDTKYDGDRAQFVEAVRQALYASKICCYAQGFELLRAAGDEYNWHLRYGDLARIWRGGCIIRARFLHRITEAFEAEPDLQNLLLAPYFRDAVHAAQTAWRHVVVTAVALGIPIPAFSSALAYFDALRQERLPANLIQAQRDYFGAHTYERVDREGAFHTEWV